MTPRSPRLSKLCAPRGIRAGFTFLELLVVVAIIGVITAAVLPVFSSTFRSVKVRDAKSDLLAVITHTQESAVRDSREYRFYLDPELGQYWVGYHAGSTKEGAKRFLPVEDTWGKPVTIPEPLEVGRPKMRKDEESEAFFLSCYPNGACDHASIEVTSRGRNGARFEIETLGAMGQFKVKER